MGSQVSPIVANLFMEDFERKALASATYLPGFGIGLWMTWVIQKQAHKSIPGSYINNIDLAIKFTVEGTQGNGLFPSLTPSSHPQQTIHYPLKCTQSPLILTNTYNGTAIIASQLSFMS